MFDEYLAGLEEGDRRALQHVIDHVREIVPHATEGRSYGVVAFRYRNKPLIGFAVTKTHLSLYPFSPAALDSVRDELAEYKLSKGAVGFSAAQPLPDEVLTKVVRTRLQEIEGAAP